MWGECHSPLHGRQRMPFAPTRTPKNEPGFTPKTVWEPETWAVFACVSVWGGWSAPLRRSKPRVGGLSVGVRRSKPHVGGLSVGVRRSKPRVVGLSVGVRRSKPRVGGLSVGVQRLKPRVVGLSVGVQRLKPRVVGLSVGVRRSKPRVGRLSVDVQGSKTPRPDPYGDAPASFLFERQVRLEACTVGVGELLQQRQLAPTADGAVLAT